MQIGKFTFKSSGSILRLAVVAAGFAMLFQSQQVIADFGAAEVGQKNNETRTFEAWCASRENACKVTFTVDSIVINDANSVKYDKIKYFNYTANHGKCNAFGFWCLGRGYIFDIVYTRNDGSEGVGKVIFEKEIVALKFLKNMRDIEGNRPLTGDPRCNGQEVFYQGTCLSPSQAAELNTRERESRNSAEAIKEHGRSIGAGMIIQGEQQRQGLESAGDSINQGLRGVKLQQNTNVIVVP